MKQAVLVLAVSSVFLSACATSPPPEPGASAPLQARSGSSVSGNVLLTQMGDKLRLDVTASNVAPGEHGFHVHEAGDCSAPDASSAKGHYNPSGKRHGHHDKAERHAGDLPNLLADASGNVKYSAEVGGVTLAEVIGRSVVMHADPDDYVSQPAGNSGKRIACGVITAR